MRIIYKYTVPLMGYATISIPRVREWVHVAMRHGEVTCWAMIEQNSPPEMVGLEIMPTGQVIPDRCLRHIGSVLTQGGDLVWHVFERLP